MHKQFFRQSRIPNLSGIFVRLMKKTVATKWVAISGGFDPIHVGHIRMFQAARKLGDKLVVILNNDNWLKLKKGFSFMPEDERKEMIEAFSEVDKVVLTSHTSKTRDISICKELEKIHPDVFANGGDRLANNIPEVQLCKKLGIQMVFNVGKGGKIQSSSWMIQSAAEAKITTRRPWGSFKDLADGSGWHLKTVTVKRGGRLSLQKHKHRGEMWILVEGDAIAEIEQGARMKKFPLVKFQLFQVPKGSKHRLSSKSGGILVEIAQGKFDEQDIERFADDYGRS